MQEIGTGLHIIRRDFYVPGLGNIGGCASVVQLDDGSLIVINPVKPKPEVIAELKSLGDVRFIVSPNPFHNLFLLPTREHFPAARLAGPVELEYRVKAIDLDITLNEQTMSTWEPQLSVLSVQARPPMHQELVFFHPRSRSLIVTDLMFNLAVTGNLWNRIWRALNGAGPSPRTTRIGRMAFKKESVQKLRLQLEALDPLNIVFAHGAPEIGGARKVIREGLSWAD
jgi:hypothetical protein